MTTRRSVEYVSVGSAPAKGKRKPISAWEAIAVVALPGMRGAEGLSAPMRMVLQGRPDGPRLTVLGDP